MAITERDPRLGVLARVEPAELSRVRWTAFMRGAARLMDFDHAVTRDAFATLRSRCHNDLVCDWRRVQRDFHWAWDSALTSPRER